MGWESNGKKGPIWTDEKAALLPYVFPRSLLLWSVSAVASAVGGRLTEISRREEKGREESGKSGGREGPFRPRSLLSQSLRVTRNLLSDSQETANDGEGEVFEEYFSFRCLQNNLAKVIKLMCNETQGAIGICAYVSSGVCFFVHFAVIKCCLCTDF